MDNTSSTEAANTAPSNPSSIISTHTPVQDPQASSETSHHHQAASLQPSMDDLFADLRTEAGPPPPPYTLSAPRPLPPVYLQFRSAQISSPALDGRSRIAMRRAEIRILSVDSFDLLSPMEMGEAVEVRRGWMIKWKAAWSARPTRGKLEDRILRGIVFVLAIAAVVVLCLMATVADGET